jgi:hypothetical protein
MNSDSLIGLLQEVAEFLDPYVDVRDGEDGPLPNKAMSLLQSVEDEIERLKKACSRCGRPFPHTIAECNANERHSD